MIKKNASLALLASLIVVLSIGATQQPNKQDDDSIRDLLVQREQILQDLVVIARKHYEQGVGSLDSVIEAEQALLDAQLESATSAEQRIDIRESQLALAKEQERVISKLVEVSAANPTDLMTAKVERLNAEIELMKEKQSL